MRNGRAGGTEVWTQGPLCRAPTAPCVGGCGADDSSFGFAGRSCLWEHSQRFWAAPGAACDWETQFLHCLGFLPLDSSGAAGGVDGRRGSPSSCWRKVSVGLVPVHN